VFDSVGRSLAAYLTRPVVKPAGNRAEAKMVAETLAPGDVLLVEGNTRMSAVIKYLTQSMWSHAALFVGSRGELPKVRDEVATLIEADVLEGVRAVPLSFYEAHRVRICRPVRLTPEDRERLLQFMIRRLGQQYDLKNVFDLMRYLLPIPVPARFRRRLMAFGSGDPSRAICSTLIAQAFGAVRYPILPVISRRSASETDGAEQERELWRIRHHSLYVPRDFDVSPFFEVVKPRIARTFDYQEAPWSEGGTVIMGDSTTVIHPAPKKKDSRRGS
jgi:Permuted papain-like amidase enzyme, YaeF/YiiX, C92 family